MYIKTEQARFNEDFEKSFEISMPKGTPDQLARLLPVAWEVYWNAREAPLGIQIFGRHKKSANDKNVPGPGIELYDAAYATKRGVIKDPATGKIREETIPERAKRVGPEIAGQLKHPTDSDLVMSKMEYNFGVASHQHQSAGSIQRLKNEHWSVNINDAWLLGGVHGHHEFHLASDKVYKNFFANLENYNLTVTGRELLGLLTAGYSRAKGYHASLGDVMLCQNESKADEMTLLSYATIAQGYEGKDNQKNGALQLLARKANFDLVAA